jgi:prevent-host-death family protein
MATVPQRELRNNSGELLRRAEAGEELTVTVAGRPVAQLGPLPRRRWVRLGDLDELWALQGAPTLMADLEAFAGDIPDPFAPEDKG